MKNKIKKEIIFFGSGTYLKVLSEIAILNNLKIKGVIIDKNIRKKGFII